MYKSSGGVPGFSYYNTKYESELRVGLPVRDRRTGVGPDTTRNDANRSCVGNRRIRCSIVLRGNNNVD